MQRSTKMESKEKYRFLSKKHAANVERRKNVNRKLRFEHKAKKCVQSKNVSSDLN